MAKFDLATVKDVVPMEEGDELNGIINSDVKMAGRMSAIEHEEYEKFETSGSLEVTGMHYTSSSFAYPVEIKSMIMQFTPHYVVLEKYDSKVGNSDMQMDGRIDNFLAYALKDSMLHGTFNFNAGYLDINELMAEDTTAVEQAEVASDTAEVPMSIVEVPDNLNVTLNASIAKMLYDNLTLTDVSGAVVIKESKVIMDDLFIAIPDLEGNMNMSGSYSTQDITKPMVDFDLDMQAFDIAKTFNTFNTVQKLVPIGKYSSGKFNTSIHFVSELDDKMEPVMNSLNGGGKIVTKSVKVAGFKPIDKLADVLKMPEYKRLAIQDVNASYEFHDGRVYVKETPVKLGDSKAVIHGSTGFDQTIDYTWEMEVPRAAFGAKANDAATGLLNDINSKLGSNMSMSDKVKFNVVFGGTATEPTVKTRLKGGVGGKQEIKEQVKEAVKEAVKEVVDDAKEKAREAAKKEADKIMKDAQAQADKIKAEAQRLADKTKQEGYAAIDKGISEAGNLFAKKALQAAAPKAKQKVDKKAQAIVDEGNNKADAVLQRARVEADKKLQQ